MCITYVLCVSCWPELKSPTYPEREEKEGRDSFSTDSALRSKVSLFGRGVDGPELQRLNKHILSLVLESQLPFFFFFYLKLYLGHQ